MSVVHARDRHIATLVASGFTSDECAKKLGVSTATIDRARARQDVQDLIEQKAAAGLSPRDVLESLMASGSVASRSVRAADTTCRSDRAGVPRTTRARRRDARNDRASRRRRWTNTSACCKIGCCEGMTAGSCQPAQSKTRSI